MIDKGRKFAGSGNIMAYAFVVNPKNATVVYYGVFKFRRATWVVFGPIMKAHNIKVHRLGPSSRYNSRALFFLLEYAHYIKYWFIKLSAYFILLLFLIASRRWE